MIRRQKRWRSRTVRSGGKRKAFLLLFILFAFFSLQSYIFIEKNLSPPLMHVAKVRLKQIATQSINKAISDRIAHSTETTKLIDWKTDASGKITGLMMNYSEHMKITADAIVTVKSELDKLQHMTERIPLGQALKSPILASFGPEIPVRLVPAGSVEVELSTRQQNAGINMLLVEVYVRIITEVSIIIPFDTAPEVVEIDVPVSYILVVGDVPMYYFDNKGNPVGNSGAAPPSISLPGTLQKPEDNNKEAPLPNEAAN